MTDLLALTAALVDIPSVSHHEQELVDWLDRELALVDWLTVTRVGDNLVARTELGRAHRLVLAGHTDTVPPHGNEGARLEGDTLWGLGAADMKGGLATMVELARTLDEPALDVTYVFYAREEVAGRHSGLQELFDRRPDLLQADAAVLGEPTGGTLEAGCQGTMRVRIELVGARAHTARSWMGTNAIHRLGALLTLVDGHEPRRPIVDGCQFREALQAVYVEGGVAGNVVPDHAEVVVNHRFAPDRDGTAAEAHVRELLAPVLGPDDRVTVTELAEAARPRLDHPLLATLVGRNALEVRAKLGWTDVARFAAHGIPAANFGPGDSHLAHTSEERLERAPLERGWAALRELLVAGPTVSA